MNDGHQDWDVETACDGKAAADLESSDSASNQRAAIVAVDLGAESCRVSLLRWANGVPNIQIVHRFPNEATDEGDGLRWDIHRIFAGVEEGLRGCAELAPEGIRAIGVDGWAVDYVRLDSEGQPIFQPFCYRDRRTAESLLEVHTRISPERLYALTGIQILPINTLYQLFADKSRGVEQNTPWVNLPEYVLFRLGGKRIAEYTNATQTQLVEPDNQAWCREIFEAAGLDLEAAPPIVMPGTTIGSLQTPLAVLPAFRHTALIAPACHDTASAIAGIPARGDDWAFISSGTWSLVGSVLNAPCISDAARSKNFSNEGGIGGKTYFLKNVNGMWLLRQCMEHWQSQGKLWTAEQLIEASASLPAPDRLLEVDDADLMLPGKMPERINAQLLRSGGIPISEEATMAPRVANLIFHSLAARYAAVLQDLAEVTKKQPKLLYIVGGGSLNAFLNRLTARATGLEVIVASTESATIGNFAVQLAALAGHYAPDVGVTSSAVAKWAEILSGQRIESLASPAQSVLTN
jgi:rhamnulokinase